MSAPIPDPSLPPDALAIVQALYAEIGRAHV